MRAVRLHGSDEARVETIPTPTPSIGDELVEVHAAVAAKRRHELAGKLVVIP